MPRYSDAQYGAALNARQVGDLPKQKETERVMIGGIAAEVPIGQFLHALRSAGRVEPSEQVLTDAFQRHGITPREVPGTGRWTVPQTGNYVAWKDAHYAAALNAREAGDLPKRKETERVMIGGVAAEVPIGQFLDNLRKKGRRKPLEQVLTDAFQRHDIIPRKDPGTGLWTVPRTGNRLGWQDAHYAAALNARQAGDLPKHRGTERVMIGGIAAEVPIGNFLENLRSAGRRKPLEQVLTDAFERHGITPREVPGTGLWTVPRTGNRLGWQDAHYAAALNARQAGDLPRQRETERVMIGGVAAEVPIGRFLNDLRSAGRTKPFEQVLTEAFQKHGLFSDLCKDDRWTISAAVEDAGRAEGFHDGQQFPQNPVTSRIYHEPGAYRPHDQWQSTGYEMTGGYHHTAYPLPTGPELVEASRNFRVDSSEFAYFADESLQDAHHTGPGQYPPANPTGLTGATTFQPTPPHHAQNPTTRTRHNTTQHPYQPTGHTQGTPRTH